MFYNRWQDVDSIIHVHTKLSMKVVKCRTTIMFMYKLPSISLSFSTKNATYKKYSSYQNNNPSLLALLSPYLFNYIWLVPARRILPNYLQIKLS